MRLLNKKFARKTAAAALVLATARAEQPLFSCTCSKQTCPPADRRSRAACTGCSRKETAFRCH